MNKRINKRVFSGALALAMLAGNFVGVIGGSNSNVAYADSKQDAMFAKYEPKILNIANESDDYLTALGYQKIEIAGFTNDIIKERNKFIFEHPDFKPDEIPTDDQGNKLWDPEEDPFYGIWYYPLSYSYNVKPIHDDKFYYHTNGDNTGGGSLSYNYDGRQHNTNIAKDNRYKQLSLTKDVDVSNSYENIQRLPDKGYFYETAGDNFLNNREFKQLLDKYGYEFEFSEMRSENGQNQNGRRILFRKKTVNSWNYNLPPNVQSVTKETNKKSVAFDEANKDNKSLVATASKPVIYTAKDNVTVGMKNEKGDQLSKQQLVNLPKEYKDQVKDYFWIEEPDTSKALIANASKEAKLGLRFDDGSVSEVPVKYTVKELPSVMTAEALNKKNTDARSRYARVDYVLKGADFTKNDNVKAPDVKVEGKVFDLSDWFSK